MYISEEKKTRLKEIYKLGTSKVHKIFILISKIVC